MIDIGQQGAKAAGCISPLISPGIIGVPDPKAFLIDLTAGRLMRAVGGGGEGEGEGLYAGQKS